MRPSTLSFTPTPLLPFRVVDAASDLLSQKRARVRTVEARLSSLLRGYQGGEVSQQGGRMCVVLLAGEGGERGAQPDEGLPGRRGLTAGWPHVRRAARRWGRRRARGGGGDKGGGGQGQG